MAARSRDTQIRNLRNDAAGDAAHDFTTDRGVFNFKEIFNAGYKLIGTPERPNEALSKEWQLINSLLLLEPYGTGEEACGHAFKDAFIGQELTDGNERRFTRFDEDPVEYVVHSKRVAIKPAGSAARQWQQSSADLYNFLNRGDGTQDFTFTIDAANVPIAEGLTIDKVPAGGASTHTANYVLSREGIIDGAGKTNKGMADSEQNVVRIKKIYDDSTTTVAYPATDIARLATLHPTEMFFSNYPIHIPATRITHGIRATSIQFTNRIMTGHKDRFKSIAEDKNPNTVSKLSRILLGLADLIRARPAPNGLSVEERDYHMGLQLKRAGDWLQVLACIVPERFGLPADRKLRMVTEDRICLLYALKMGVDVVYTLVRDGPDGSTEYWLITLYKDRAATTPRQRIVRELSSLKNPENGILGDRPGNYVECRDTYIAQYNQIEAELTANFQEKLVDVRDRLQLTPVFGRDSSLEHMLRHLLKAAMRIIVFRQACPKIESKSEELIYQAFTRYNEAKAAADEAAAEATITDARIPIYNSFIPFYRRQWNIIETAAKVKMGLADALTSTQSSLNLYFATYRPGISTTALQARFRVIDKIEFHSRGFFSAGNPFFAPSNSNENGTGIFSYLNQGLRMNEKQDIIAFMASMRSYVSLFNKEKYDSILKLAKLLQYDDREGQAVQPGPGITEISSVSLLGSMLFPDTSNALQEAGIEAGEDDRAIIEITDAYAENILLAQRAQGHFGDAARIAVQADMEDIIRQGIDPDTLVAAMQGGGIDEFNHNPMNTFCIILYELNSCLSSSHPDMYLLNTLSRIIEEVVYNDVKKLGTMKSPHEIYEYLYSVEAFLLEGLAEALPNRGFEHFMATVKEDYYGIHKVVNYNRLMQLTYEQIQEYTSIKPRRTSAKEMIQFNQMLMLEAFKIMEIIEKIAIASNKPAEKKRVRHGTKRKSRVNEGTRKIRRVEPEYEEETINERPQTPPRIRA
jgi:hypothetical protein